MNTAKLIKHHPTITCQSDLVEICKPLQKLNIVYFAHVHIDEQSNISGISLCPDFFKIYINHGFHQYDLHMSNLFGKRSHIVWKTVGIKKQSKEMHNYFTRFDRDHTFSIIKTSSTTKNYYHFAARIKHDFMNNKYLELLEELHCFINYFTDQVQLNKKLRTAYDIKIPINNNFGGFFFDGQIQDDNLIDFCSDLKTERFYFDHLKYLTKRELECLYWTSKGKTAIEISIILNITERTIKEHFRNIKQKLNCRTLFQLGMKYGEWLRSLVL